MKDADVYLLRMVLHDWPEDEAVAILQRIAEAMKAGSRILVMDMVLPAQGTCSPTLEAALRQKDMMMRQVLQAHEREVEDWQELVSKTGGRLRIVAIRQLESSQYVSQIQIGHSSAHFTRLDTLSWRLRRSVSRTVSRNDCPCFSLHVFRHKLNMPRFSNDVITLPPHSTAT